MASAATDGIVSATLGRPLEEGCCISFPLKLPGKRLTIPMTISDKQRAICQRFDADYLPPGMEQMVGIALDTLDKLPLYATRIPPENGTCGWDIYGGDYSSDPGFYQALHARTWKKFAQESCPTWPCRQDGA